MKKEEKGITLIALVITIIVLLLIAGIAISALFGDKGIISMAKEAEFKTTIKNIEEEIDIALMTRETFFGEIQEIISGKNVDEYNSKLQVHNKELVYLEKEFSKQEIEWLEEINIKKAGEYILIFNEEEMEEFRDNVNKGETYEGITVYLLADLNMGTTEEEQWVPIGDYGSNNTLKFTGTFEGNGHIIKGIYIKGEKDYQGLFGYNEGEIENVEIAESTIEGTAETVVGERLESKGSSFYGAIAGYNKGTVEGCDNSINISGNYSTGGIVGFNEGGIVRENTNEGNITGKVNKNGIGGVVGTNYKGEVIDCVNKGIVEGKGYVGGIVGQNRYILDELELSGEIPDEELPIVNNCINEGNVIMSATDTYAYTGGITGYSHGQVLNCTNKGSVTNNSTGQYVYAAGIIGRQSEASLTGNIKIDNCINEGEIINNGIGNDSSYIYTAGIVGGNNGEIYNSINKARLINNGTGQYVYTAGIASYSSKKIDNCINESKITDNSVAEFNYVAGILGTNNSEVYNCLNNGDIEATGTVLYSMLIAGINASNNANCTIKKCTNTGNIVSKTTASNIEKREANYAAGISGVNHGTVENCNNEGNIELEGNNDIRVYAAGITAGNGSSTEEQEDVIYTNIILINACYNSGDIVIRKTGENIITAGISCYAMNTIIINSYNVGNLDNNGVASEQLATAGILGVVVMNIDNITVKNCYSIGNIYNTGSSQGVIKIGGIIGRKLSEVNILNNYYLNGTVNNGNGGINSNDVSGAAEGKNSEYLKSNEFIQLLNNNKEYEYVTWGIDTGINNNGYPIIIYSE